MPRPAFNDFSTPVSPPLGSNEKGMEAILNTPPTRFLAEGPADPDEKPG